MDLSQLNTSSIKSGFDKLIPAINFKLTDFLVSCFVVGTFGEFNSSLILGGLDKIVMGLGANVSTVISKALSKVFDPRVVRIAAYIAVLLSFSPKFAMVIEVMPAGIVGGISFMLYGMIAAIGVRNVVEAQVDFSKSRNVIVAAIIVVSALGIKFSSGMGADVVKSFDGSVKFSIAGVGFSLSGLAVAAIAGIVLNLLFPDKDEVIIQGGVEPKKETEE